MFPSISPYEKSLVFTFAGEDCLYRDHHGSRVLADAEGGGFFQIDPSPRPLSVTVDDTLQEGFEGSYDRSLLVTSPEPGPCRVLTCTRRPDSIGGSLAKAEKFEGCGWILSADRIDDLDGEHADRKSADVRDPRSSVPFFRGCSGALLQVVRAAETSITIDAFDLADELACRERGWTVQNGSKLFDLESSFPDGTPHRAEVMSHLNRASWQTPVPPGCKGLIVRKLYDAFHGRQRSRVLIDGAFTGWWYEPWQDRERRWRWARTGIDKRFLENKTQVILTIDPPAGSPLWSVSRIEVDALI